MAISAYLLIFTIGWIVFMIILPQLYMFDFSFRHNLPPPEIGGPADTYTLKNYKYLVFGRESDSDMFNWLHLEVFAKTIIASVIVTLINFALCYPLAFFMAQEQQPLAAAAHHLRHEPVAGRSGSTKSCAPLPSS